ncbi:MAG: ABC transporter permease [Flavobacteriaceae bacterium]|nr:ABC transporter permease [Bacteroidia bacterium]NNF75120.1 ABC transporter permease [Flavobacteriaceae bacterium]NNK72599.1 ABC transporter permease [Flavobacteriaceae bacterium]
MNVPFYIAKRYLFSKSSNNAINFITIIAAFGIVIGAASLFIVLSGFDGLKDFTLQFSSFVDPDLKVLPSKGKSFFITNEQDSLLKQDPDIISFSKIIEERVLLNFEDKNEGVNLKGVDVNFPQKTIDSILSRGQWFNADEREVIAGWGVANTLGFGIFDFAKTIDIYVPKPGKGQVSSVRSAFNSVRVVNVGVFQINESLDQTYVYTSIQLARQLLNYEPGQISALECIIRPDADFDAVRKRIQAILEQDLIIKDRVQLNDALYKMLNTENLAVYLIFTLIMIIALFNVIGSIIMMILDKKKNLNTLYNLGVTTKDIRKIFFLQGSLMTVLGGVIGVILGIILVVLQSIYGLVMITPSLSYPVSMKWINVLIVLATIIILGAIASKIASSRISNSLVRFDQAN